MVDWGGFWDVGTVTQGRMGIVRGRRLFDYLNTAAFLSSNDLSSSQFLEQPVSLSFPSVDLEHRLLGEKLLRHLTCICGTAGN